MRAWMLLVWTGILVTCPWSAWGSVWHKPPRATAQRVEQRGYTSWEERVYGAEAVTSAAADNVVAPPMPAHAAKGQHSRVQSVADVLEEEEGAGRSNQRAQSLARANLVVEEALQQQTPRRKQPAHADSALAVLAGKHSRCRRMFEPLPDSKSVCAVRPVRAKFSADGSESLHQTQGVRAEGAQPPSRKMLSQLPNFTPLPLARDLHCQVDCVETNWVFTNTQQLRTTHMASIVAAADGTLVVAFQASRYNEGDTDQKIMITTSKNGGRTWAPAQPVSKASSNTLDHGAQWGPVLARDGKDPHIHLFYSQSYHCRLKEREEAWSPGGNILLSISQDASRWSEPRRIAEQKTGLPLVTANPPVFRNTTKGKRTWMLPIWRELPRASTCEYPQEVSDSAVVLLGEPDPGCAPGVAPASAQVSECACKENFGAAACRQQWSIIGRIQHPKTYLIEGTLVAFDDGSLLQLFRTSRGSIFRSTSTNGGGHWSPPEATSLPNPNSKVHALLLSNGQVVVCYNAHTTKSVKDGIRTFLNVAISSNHGKTWKTLAELENAQRPEGTDYRPMFHYPTMHQRGCTLYVVYTVNFNVAGTVPMAGDTSNELRTGIRIARLDLTLSSLADDGLEGL